LYQEPFIVLYLLALIVVIAFSLLNTINSLPHIFAKSYYPAANDVVWASSAKASKDAPAVSVFNTTSKPFGLTYGDWTARWWQWAYSIPKDIHPAYDNTGKHCAVNQNGPVWFFPGTYGKSVVRDCTVPAGKAILFPILNSECSFGEFPNLKTIQQLRMCAKVFQDQVIQLQASVDGMPIPDLEKYRIQSLQFNFTLPKDNILGLPANTSTQAVADGNWVFLKPLPQGKHEITFRGNTVGSTTITTTTTNKNNNITAPNNNNSSFAFPTGWNFETTYHITVNP
jgi:hypothetical protein